MTDRNLEVLEVPKDRITHLRRIEMQFWSKAKEQKKAAKPQPAPGAVQNVSMGLQYYAAEDLHRKPHYHMKSECLKSLKRKVEKHRGTWTVTDAIVPTDVPPVQWNQSKGKTRWQGKLLSNGKRSKTTGWRIPVSGGYDKDKHTLVAQLPLPTKMVTSNKSRNKRPCNDNSSNQDLGGEPKEALEHQFWHSMDNSTTMLKLNLLSMASILHQGHTLWLWTYQNFDNLPDGVQVHDMSELLPRHRFETFLDNGTGLAHISDLIRMLILERYGGWWLDSDNIVLRPLPAQDKYYFVTLPTKREGGGFFHYDKRPARYVDSPHMQDTDGKDMLNNSPIFVRDVNDAWVGAMRQQTEELLQHSDGAIEPYRKIINLTRDLVEQHGLQRFVHPPIAFGPLPFWDCDRPFEPCVELVTKFGCELPTAERILKESFIVPLFFMSGEKESTAARDDAWLEGKMADAPADALLCRMLARTGVRNAAFHSEARRLQAELLSILRTVEISSQNRDNEKKTLFSLEWQKQLGRTVGVWPSFTHPHNFRKGIKVFMKGDHAKTTTQFQKLNALARELLKLIDPAYVRDGDYVTQFAKMSDPAIHYVRTHVDAEDIAPQYAMGLGDYTGGELRCYLNKDKTQFVDMDTRNRIVKFDGRLPHRVLPFKGNRYTVIYYKNYDRRILQPQQILMAPVVPWESK